MATANFEIGNKEFEIRSLRECCIIMARPKGREATIKKVGNVPI